VLVRFDRPIAGANKKPTTVSSRGFLSKFNLSTSAYGVAGYDDDCQQDDL